MTTSHLGDAPATQNFWTLAPHLELRRTLNSRVAYAPHLHQYLSLGLILEGQTRLSCAGECIIAQPHDMITLEPMLVHSCNPVLNQPRSYYMLYISPSWVAQQLFGDESQADCLRVCLRKFHDQSLSAALLDALDVVLPDTTLPDAGTASAEVLQRLEVALCRVLALTCTLDEKAAEPSPSFVEAAHQLALRDSATPVQDVARMTGLSRGGFIRAFRRTTGLTPGKYSHCLRIEEARRLLRMGCSIADTAFATGYADQSHFHRMFVRYCAATPRQYARSLLFKKNWMV